MKYEIPENVLKNLLVFLDRIEFKGLNENVALNEILNVLNNPIEENESE